MITANMAASDRGCANRCNKPGLAISKRPWRRKLTKRTDAKTPQFVKLKEGRYLEVKARFLPISQRSIFIDKFCAVHIFGASETGAGPARWSREKTPMFTGIK